MKTLSSNEFWGRRSGQVVKSKESFDNKFVQQQYGAGPSGNSRPVKTTLIDVNKKWFGKDYKRKK